MIQKRVGARSADAKKGRSAERRKIVERGVAMSKRVGAQSDFYPRTGPDSCGHYVNDPSLDTNNTHWWNMIS